ncbi:MAG: sigma-70 family RNA polymerase sigma factor [Alphaproteobacteria bacterium]|nr:sigma-70 family RNA polymerase sigma factor [Alphaproteobacteria bacterium]
MIARVFRDHNAALLRFLRAKLPSQQDAQEVAQEAYVRLLRLDDPNTISHLQAYLFKIAANLAVDRNRYRSRQPLFVDLDSALTTLRAPEPGQDRILDGKQDLKKLRGIIKELPPKCRLAFLLYKFEGQDYGTIANHMELSESMVRKYVLRAIVYCRQRLDGALPAGKDVKQ